MLEITLELVNKTTHDVDYMDIYYTHNQSNAQSECDKRNDKCDVNHFWRVGYIEFID